MGDISLEEKIKLIAKNTRFSSIEDLNKIYSYLYSFKNRSDLVKLDSEETISSFISVMKVDMRRYLKHNEFAFYESYIPTKFQEARAIIPYSILKEIIPLAPDHTISACDEHYPFFYITFGSGPYCGFYNLEENDYSKHDDILTKKYSYSFANTIYSSKHKGRLCVAANDQHYYYGYTGEAYISPLPWLVIPELDMVISSEIPYTNIELRNKGYKSPKLFAKEIIDKPTIKKLEASKLDIDLNNCIIELKLLATKYNKPEVIEAVRKELENYNLEIEKSKKNELFSTSVLSIGRRLKTDLIDKLEHILNNFKLYIDYIDKYNQMLELICLHMQYKNDDLFKDIDNIQTNLLPKIPGSKDKWHEFMQGVCTKYYNFIDNTSILDDSITSKAKSLEEIKKEYRVALNEFLIELINYICDEYNDSVKKEDIERKFNDTISAIKENYRNSILEKIDYYLKNADEKDLSYIREAKELLGNYVSRNDKAEIDFYNKILFLINKRCYYVSLRDENALELDNMKIRIKI